MAYLRAQGYGDAVNVPVSLNEAEAVIEQDHPAAAYTYLVIVGTWRSMLHALCHSTCR